MDIFYKNEFRILRIKLADISAGSKAVSHKQLLHYLCLLHYYSVVSFQFSIGVMPAPDGYDKYQKRDAYGK